MTTLPPWANGPFELILHAEGHLLKGEDFDRRIALISFDNSIEVSISTYLSLNPIQRGNRQYQRVDVDKWLNNYHTKLDFLEEELKSRSLVWEVENSHIIWAHDHRNEQYHGGAKGTPEKQVLTIVKNAALWVFSLLYDISDVEKLLEQTISASLPEPDPKPDIRFDRAIDSNYEMLEVAGLPYHVSEILFRVDPEAYKELGKGLLVDPNNKNDSEVDE